MRTARVSVTVGGGAVVRSLSLTVPRNGVATVVNPGNYNGDAALGTVTHVLPYTGNDVDFLNGSVRDLSRHRFTHYLTVLARSPITPASLAIRSLIRVKHFPRHDFLKHKSGSSTRRIT